MLRCCVAPRLVSYNGYLWASGGQGEGASGPTIFSDVWTSPDGTSWSQVSGGLPYPRWGHSVVAYLGLMFVIGGTTPDEYTILYSDTGGAWEVMPNDSEAQAVAHRTFAAAAVYNNAIYVAGGESPPAPKTPIVYMNDVWEWSPCAAVGNCEQYAGRAACELHANLTAVCSCIPPHTGTNCTELNPGPPKKPPSSNRGWIIVAVLASSAVVLLLCIVVLARRKRKSGTAVASAHRCPPHTCAHALSVFRGAVSCRGVQLQRRSCRDGR